MVTSVSTKVDPIVTVVSHNFDPDFLSQWTQYALHTTSHPIHAPHVAAQILLSLNYCRLYIILFIDWRFDPRCPERQRPPEDTRSFSVAARIVEKMEIESVASKALYGRQ